MCRLCSALNHGASTLRVSRGSWQEADGHSGHPGGCKEGTDSAEVGRGWGDPQGPWCPFHFQLWVPRRGLRRPASKLGTFARGLLVRILSRDHPQHKANLAVWPCCEPRREEGSRGLGAGALATPLQECGCGPVLLAPTDWNYKQLVAFQR